MTSPYEPLARVTAQRHGIDETLFCALCEHESSWYTFAHEYEAGFFHDYVAHLYTTGKITIGEAYDRAYSWGLGQIMGQTAREYGFQGRRLTELCDPTTGLEYAARKLEDCLKRESGNWRAALLRYNGGGDQSYPSLVLNLCTKYAQGATQNA